MLTTHKYYEANKEKVKADRKKYYYEHREEELEKMRIKRLQNLEFFRTRDKMYDDKHREKRKERKREFYKNNRERILQEHREFNKKPERKEYVKRYNKEYHEKPENRISKKIRRKKTEALSRRRYRRLVFEILGVKCCNSNCLVPGGCKEFKCLQIDHINGDGHKWKPRGSVTAAQYFYKHPERIKEELQILCANCNTIKAIDNNEHRWKRYTNV